MKLEKIQITRFRNIEALQLSVSPALNLISGPNGSGKTSLIEAIYFLSHGRSFRTTQLKHLIQKESDQFHLFAQLKQSQRNIKLGMTRGQDGTAENNRDGIRNIRAIDIAKFLPTLCLTPESLTMRGAKSRIKALDWLVFYCQNGFAESWTKIRRVLRQRNAGLKSGAPNQVIFALDNILVPLAEQIDSLRQAALNQLAPHLDQALSRFLPEFQFSYQYARGWPKGEALGSVLEKNLPQDRRYGSTSQGPTRADWVYRLKGQQARDVLSRGQYKLLVCAQTIAMGEMLKECCDLQPLLLMDDVCAELDLENSQKLMDYVVNSKFQVFITGICREFLVKYKGVNCQLFELRDGKRMESLTEAVAGA